MRLGFIGVGKIAFSVIKGITNSNIKYKKIILSPRNLIISKKIQKKFHRIKIAKNNQEVINTSDWVFLSITPEVGNKIIKSLKFRSKQTIVSFISTITLVQLKKMINTKNIDLVRAIPLPPISLKKGAYTNMPTKH